MPPYAPSKSDRHDAKVIGRAIRERWPIPDDVRASIPLFLGAIVAGSDDARAQVAAARALIEADKVNMEQEKRDEGIPDRVDVTTQGKPVNDVTVQHNPPATAAVLGFLRDLGLPCPGDVPADGS